MGLYAGIDLHSNNKFLAIIDDQDRRLYQKRLPNQSDVVLAELAPFHEQLTGIVVESTLNWYWLVDTLMDNGYKTHLANPTAIQKYKGLKYSNDNHDAYWVAHLLRLGILPEGYIYPKEDRLAGDLLRKRGHLVQLRTSLINSLQGIVSRSCGCKLSGNKIKQLKENHIPPPTGWPGRSGTQQRGEQECHRLSLKTDQEDRECGSGELPHPLLEPPNMPR
jgi:transposase